MPEYIKFEPLRDDILNDTEYDSDTVNHFLDIVDSQPAADVAEVRDCYKCKHFEKTSSQYPCSHCRNCYTDKFEPEEGAK